MNAHNRAAIAARHGWEVVYENTREVHLRRTIRGRDVFLWATDQAISVMQL